MKTNEKMKMNCPNCGSKISVDELLVKQFEASIKKDLETELLNRENELKQEKEEYKELSAQLIKEKESVDSLVNTKVKALLSSKEEAMKDLIRKEIDEE